MSCSTAVSLVFLNTFFQFNAATSTFSVLNAGSSEDVIIVEDSEYGLVVCFSVGGNRSSNTLPYLNSKSVGSGILVPSGRTTISGKSVS